MELFEALQNRRSYRSEFSSRLVDRNILEQIVLAGTLAPSGKNAQTTRFVVVDDESIVSKIAAIPGGSKAFKTAKAYIVCLVDKVPEAVVAGLEFQVEDCAAAVENILLAVASFGLASVWVDGWLRADARNQAVCDILNVEKGKIARVILPIGYPIEKVVAPEKLPMSMRVSFNRYNFASEE